jgi:glycosyltransferase involved in cell wall biosynthesis
LADETLQAKKLLLFNTNLARGGAERQIVHLARCLDRSRWAISILLLHGGEEGYLADVPEDVQVITLSASGPKPRLGKVFWAIQQAIGVRRFLRDHPCDVVLTFLWFPTLLCALALPARGRKTRLVWSVQSDLAADCRQKPLGWLRWFVVKRWVLPKVDRFIAISSGVRKAIETMVSPAAKLSLVHNAVDIRLAERMKVARCTPPKQPDRLRILAVGRLVPQKGYEDLLVAFAETVRKLPREAELFILGEGPERARLQALMVKLRVDEHVRLVGTVGNTYAWMNTADLFVMPSRWEPFGIALVEAMALGLPVISTATDGARDIVESGIDGLLVPIGEPDSLAQAILHLARSAEARAALGRRAFEKAKRFDVSVVVPRYDDVLQSVLRE